MRIAALALLALAAACSHSTIPGTKIPDNEQTRAVIEVFGKYKTALEARDANGLLALAAPTYFDAGDPARSSSPTDYAALQRKLDKDFEHVAGLKLEATIKDVLVKGDEANIDYFQVLRYAVGTPTGERWKSESDDARMKLIRTAGEWKISAGL